MATYAHPGYLYCNIGTCMSLVFLHSHQQPCPPLDNITAYIQSTPRGPIPLLFWRRHRLKHSSIKHARPYFAEILSSRWVSRSTVDRIGSPFPHPNTLVSTADPESPVRHLSGSEAHMSANSSKSQIRRNRYPRAWDLVSGGGTSA
jgi:hypothetical protein